VLLHKRLSEFQAICGVSLVHGLVHFSLTHLALVVVGSRLLQSFSLVISVKFSFLMSPIIRKIIVLLQRCLNFLNNDL